MEETEETDWGPDVEAPLDEVPEDEMPPIEVPEDEGPMEETAQDEPPGPDPGDRDPEMYAGEAAEAEPDSEPQAAGTGEEAANGSARGAEEPEPRLIHASERPDVVRWFEDQIEVNVVRRLTGSVRDPGEGKEEGMSDGEQEELLAESLFIYKRMEGK